MCSRKLQSVFTTLVLLGLLIAAPARADDRDEAWPHIAAALEAIGGAEKVVKAHSQTWDESGTFYGMGDGVPYTGKLALQWPNKFRMEIVGVFTLVLNGDKGWVVTNDGTREMTEEELAEQKESHFSGWLTTLVPLKDEQFQLKMLPDARVEGRPAVAIKVSHEDHRPVTLYFDKESKLLVKSDQRVRAPELGGQEVLQEAYYRDYKEVEGVKIPSAIDMKRDGKKFVEATIKNLDLSPEFDKDTFTVK